MLSLQTVKNRQNFIAAALAAHAALWFADHCAASVNSAEYQASVENALAEAEAAFDAPTAQEIENIFAILDEPAETPLTPSQLEAEALSDLQTIVLECDMAIRQHIADDGHLTDKANKEARLIRAEARRIVAGFTTWLDRGALHAA